MKGREVTARASVRGEAEDGMIVRDYEASTETKP